MPKLRPNAKVADDQEALQHLLRRGETASSANVTKFRVGRLTIRMRRIGIFEVLNQCLFQPPVISIMRRLAPKRQIRPAALHLACEHGFGWNKTTLLRMRGMNACDGDPWRGLVHFMRGF
jgi:hypothetical protein